MYIYNINGVKGRQCPVTYHSFVFIHQDLKDPDTSVFLVKEEDCQ